MSEYQCVVRFSCVSGTELTVDTPNEQHASLSQAFDAARDDPDADDHLIVLSKDYPVEPGDTVVLVFSVNRSLAAAVFGTTTIGGSRE